MIKAVYRFPNNNILVFDEDGEQILKYQKGGWEAVRENLKKAISPETKCYWSEWKLHPAYQCVEVPAKNFFV